MKIVLVSQLAEPETIEVDSETIFDEFEMIAGLCVNIDPADLVLKKDGKVVKGTKTCTLSSLGIRDGDVFITSKRPRQIHSAPPNKHLIDFSGINASSVFRGSAAASSSRQNPFSEQMRQQLLRLPPDLMNQFRLSNPALMDAINDPVKFGQIFSDHQRMAMDQKRELQDLNSADVMDPNVQKRIEEVIRKNNIDAQMEHAIEHNPESFAQTTMLYINCKVNKNDAKAFIDSGAQMSFISSEFAKRCHVDHLIDIRWKGMARGVGTQNIVGRVHCIELEISGVFLQMSVSVLENQEMDMLIGLDMLKRFQCIINLKRNVLEIGSVGVETPFLPENELPLYARLHETQAT